ncbi:MAG: hypothetical protein P4N60_02460 [Verrucomicrobiae bacterium]|nr:hypothetical protein [Verrucomicrobiae bacterium]
MKALVIYASIIGLLAAAANAADITWQAPVAISGTADVNTQGTLYGSWAPGDDYQGDFNSAPQNYTVNGVPFNTYGTPGVDFGISGSGINLDRYNGFASPNTGDSIYNNLLQVAIFNWNSGSSDMIVSWDNLIVGHTYLVQAWVNDGRGGQSGTSTFIGGVSNSAPVAIGNGVPGQYIIGTFVADGGSQSFTMTPGIMLNLLQVRDISPTPNVTWGTPTAISGPDDVKINGNYFGSWAPYNQDAFNNGSSGLVVNGTKFVASSDLPNLFTVGFNNGYGGYNNPNTSDANYNDLLQTATYEGFGDGRPVSLSWTGMKPGHTYQIQIWANDGRGNGRTEKFTGGANTSATVDFGDAPGQYIVGTFVADSGGRQVISLSGAGSPNGPYPQVNLVQVRDLTTTPDITWQAPAPISGPSDVATNGAYFASWAPYNQDSANNGSSGLVVNGTKFLAFNDFPNFNTIGFNNGYNGYNNPGTADANYNDLLQTATYEGFGDGRPVSLSWGGMTPGHAYLVQIWANDGRGNGRTESFTGGGNTSDTVYFGNAPGEYVIGTFVANSSGLQTIDLSGLGSPNGDYPQLNLIQVRDLNPQPRLTAISVNGTTLNLSAVHGSNSGQYVLLGTTNLTKPLSQWTPILTNYLDGGGNLNLSTNILNPAVGQQFFMLKQ